MSTLAWIKERTRPMEPESLTAEGKTYKVTREFFAGRFRKSTILRLIMEPLEFEMKHPDGSISCEWINWDRSSNRIEYSRTIYTPA